MLPVDAMRLADNLEAKAKEGDGYALPLTDHQLHVLTEEVGELAGKYRALKGRARKPAKIQAVLDEAADVVITVGVFLELLGREREEFYTMDDIVKRKLERIQRRGGL